MWRERLVRDTRSRTDTVTPMNVPAELLYSAEHEWARPLDDGSTIRIGITDYAQDALGDVVFVDLPAIGTVVAASDAVGELESTKSVSEMYAPVSGTVVAINEALANSPQLINEDPYGEGWLCVIEISDSSELDSLLDAASYLNLTEG